MDSYENVLISAPTGTGKSAIAYTIARIMNNVRKWKSYIITYRKALQQQYNREFGIPVMWGRNNYYCLATEEICSKCLKSMACAEKICTVDKAPCATQKDFKCPEKNHCPYRIAKHNAMTKPITVIGSRYVLVEQKYVKKMPGRELMIFDEAHRAEDEILSIIEFTINKKMIETVWDDEALTLYKRGDIAGTIYWRQTKGMHLSQGLDGYIAPKIDDFITDVEPFVRDNQIPELTAVLDWATYLYETSAVAEAAYMKLKMEYEDLSKEMSTLGLKKFLDKYGEAKYQLMLETSDTMEFLKSVSERALYISKAISRDPDNWVFYMSKDKKRVKFRPVFVAKEARAILESIGKKRVFMSATLDPVHIIEGLGLYESETLFIQVDTSPFPVKNRPIYFIPAGNMSRKHYDDSKDLVFQKIKEIIEANPDKRILILPFSYKIAKDILDTITVKPSVDPMVYEDALVEWADKMGYSESIKFHIFRKLVDMRDNRLMTHGQDNMTRTVDIKIYETVPGSVMVSTYLNEGYDGVNDKVRVLIIPKVPYPDLNDPVIQKRFRKSKDWYRHYTMMSIIQQCGRGVRNADDYCDTYILDSSFMALYLGTERYIPGWFREAIVWPKKEG